MVIVELKGGLGNQMFQYAVAKIIATKHNSKVLLDTSFYYDRRKNKNVTPRSFELDVFQNNYIIASKEQLQRFKEIPKYLQIRKLLGIKYVKRIIEKQYTFDSSVMKAYPPVYLKGYFQSYKYLLGSERLILETFRFKEYSLRKKNVLIKEGLQNKNSVAIHVRRGDYISNPKTSRFHGNLTLDYYFKAIDIINSKVDDAHLYFFSDDIEWVKEAFKKVDNSSFFIEGNEGVWAWQDMCLMSHCNHNIIANSSFSWWGAWLNNNTEKIVIAPNKWIVSSEMGDLVSDRIPEDWIIIGA